MGKDSLSKAFEDLGVVVSATNNNIAQVDDFTDTYKIVGGSQILVSDRIRKSTVLGSIGSISDSIAIEKDGKDIRAALINIKAMNEVLSSKYAAEMALYLAKCGGKVPDEEIIDSWDLKGTRVKWASIPLGFSYADIESADPQRSQEPYGVTYASFKPTVEPNNFENPYRKYNQATRKYVDCKVEAMILDTIANNIVDGTKYKLTVEQLTKLGL